MKTDLSSGVKVKRPFFKHASALFFPRKARRVFIFLFSAISAISLRALRELHFPRKGRRDWFPADCADYRRLERDYIYWLNLPINYNM